VTYIDEHQHLFGVEPICRTLTAHGWPIASGTYRAYRRRLPSARARVFGDTSGAGTTGIDDSYAAAHFEGIGAEIMGAAMFVLDDPRLWPSCSLFEPRHAFWPSLRGG
jgi:hypothetical protein